MRTMIMKKNKFAECVRVVVASLIMVMCVASNVYAQELVIFDSVEAESVADYSEYSDDGIQVEIMEEEEEETVLGQDHEMYSEESSDGISKGELFVHFIAVGSADSILVQYKGSAGNWNMLVDAGTVESKYDLVQYLKKVGISSIDRMVITHAHGDHMGGAAEVLKNFDVKDFDIPYPEKLKKKDGREELFAAVEDEGLSYNKGPLDRGTVLYSAENDGFEAMVVSDSKRFKKDPNGYSTIILLRFGAKKVLLMGDSVKKVENELVKAYAGALNGVNLIKIGHHGASDASADNLCKLAPEYAINCYGIPTAKGKAHTNTFKRWVKYNNDIQIYQTGVNGGLKAYQPENMAQGTMIAATDGETFEVYRGITPKGQQLGLDWDGSVIFPDVLYNFE